MKMPHCKIIYWIWRSDPYALLFWPWACLHKVYIFAFMIRNQSPGFWRKRGREGKGNGLVVCLGLCAFKWRGSKKVHRQLWVWINTVCMCACSLCAWHELAFEYHRPFTFSCFLTQSWSQPVRFLLVVANDG